MHLELVIVINVLKGTKKLTIYAEKDAKKTALVAMSHAQYVKMGIINMK